LALDESKTPDDEIYEAYGVTVVANRNLAEYLDGVVIDYVESELGSGFQILNSNPADCSGCSSGSCGS
jgi:iron-sulfur cluster assembly protein